jgi:hypothetical protein
MMFLLDCCASAYVGSAGAFHVRVLMLVLPVHSFFSFNCVYSLSWQVLKDGGRGSRALRG